MKYIFAIVVIYFFIKRKPKRDCKKGKGANYCTLTAPRWFKH